jgi:hypothetical protein
MARDAAKPTFSRFFCHAMLSHKPLAKSRLGRRAGIYTPGSLRYYAAIGGSAADLDGFAGETPLEGRGTSLLDDGKALPFDSVALAFAVGRAGGGDA